MIGDKFKFNLPLPYKSQADNRRSDALMTINVQRKLHYRSMNSFKEKYGSKLSALIPQSHPKMEATRLTYTLHIPPTKGKPTKKEPFRGSEPKNLDLMNLLAVVDKVFSDELVKATIIPDDSIRHVQEILLKVNPWATEDRIEATVEEIAPLPDPRLKETL